MSNDVVVHVKSKNETQSDLDGAKRSFDVFAKDVGKAGLSAGISAGTSFGKEMSKAGSQAAGQLAPILIAGGIAAAPGLAGAIIGGAGIGGVVGGVLIASKDARVKSAYEGLGKGIETRLTKAASGFVAPTIAGVETIKGAIDTIDFEGIFKNSEKFVAPLASGVGKAISELGDGIEDLVANAGPAVEAIGDGIGNIGEAVGEGLSSLADNGESAAAALDTLFDTMSTGVDIGFGTLNMLTELNEKLQGTGLEAGSGLKLINALWDKLTEGEEVIGTWVEGQTAAQAATEANTMSLEELADAADKARDAQLGLFGSLTDVGEAEDAAAEAAKKNGKTLDTHTEKGRANRHALENLGSALRRNYENFKDLNGLGPRTDAVNARNRSSFISAATGMGLAASKARDLANKIFGIPPARSTTVNLNSAVAKQRAIDVRNAIDNIHGKTVTITVRERINRSYAGNSITGGKSSGGIQGAADGAMSSGLTWTGENGPELLDLPPGTGVKSAGDSKRIANQSNGNGDVYLTYVPSGHRGMDSFITEEVLPRLQKTNRNRYGNSAERMLAG